MHIKTRCIMCRTGMQRLLYKYIQHAALCRFITAYIYIYIYIQILADSLQHYAYKDRCMHATVTHLASATVLRTVPWLYVWIHVTHAFTYPIAKSEHREVRSSTQAGSYCFRFPQREDSFSSGALVNLRSSLTWQLQRSL